MIPNIYIKNILIIKIFLNILNLNLKYIFKLLYLISIVINIILSLKLTSSHIYLLIIKYIFLFTIFISSEIKNKM